MYWTTQRLKKVRTDSDYIVMQHPLPVTGNVFVMGVKFCGRYGVIAKNTKEYFQIKKIPQFRKAKEFPLDYLKRVHFKPNDVKLVFGYDIYCHFMESLGFDPQGKPLIEKEEKEEKVVAIDKKEVENIKQSLREELEEEKKKTDESFKQDIEKLIVENKEELDALADVSREGPEGVMSEEERNHEEVEKFLKEDTEESLAELEKKEKTEFPPLSLEEISAAHKEMGKCCFILEDKVCENDVSKSSPSGFCFGHIRFDPKRKSFGKKERRKRRKKTKEE